MLWIILFKERNCKFSTFFFCEYVLHRRSNCRNDSYLIFKLPLIFLKLRCGTPIIAIPLLKYLIFYVFNVVMMLSVPFFAARLTSSDKGSLSSPLHTLAHSPAPYM